MTFQNQTQTQTKNQNNKSLQKTFNNFDKIWRILSILFLGFSAGMPLALTGSALSMWLSRLGIDVKTIGLFSLVAIPFSFKYLWSPIFDNVAIPYFSRRFGLRKSWLISSQILLMFSIIALGQTSPLSSIHLTALAALSVSFFSATQDILIDAVRIEILDKEEQAIGASMYVYGYRIAMLVSGAGSILLADHLSWSIVFSIMGLGILVGIITTIFIKEPTYSDKHLEKIQPFSSIIKSALDIIITKEFLYMISFVAIIVMLISLKVNLFLCLSITAIVIYLTKDRFKSVIPDSILDFCNRPQWGYIFLFIIFYKFSDTLLDSLKSKFYVDSGFSNSEIAYITKGLGFIMTMLGLFVGGLIYYKLKTYKSLMFSAIIQILSNLLFIWIAKTDHNLLALSVAISIENFTGAINTVVVVAYLSSLCNINYTATQYALLSSLSNIGRTIMVAPGGYIVSSFGWVNFILCTAIVGIPSIILLYLMKDNINKVDLNEN